MKLRKPQANDFDFLLKLLTDNRVRAYLGGAVLVDEAKSRVAALLDRKPRCYWIIESNSYQVGTVVFDQHIDSNEVELSYTLLPEYWGKGIAFEAVQTALKQKGSDVVVAETQAKNIRSRKLLDRLGFKEVKGLERFGEMQIYYEWTNES